MLILETIAEIRDFVSKERAGGRAVGFVPTMGYLHEGHLSLVRRAQEECGPVVVSIFVNPLQFGPKEDFSVYPRDLERDSRLLEECGVDALFHPPGEEMYPGRHRTIVEVGGITGCLCGTSRPGHFQGVATVVTKLLNIVQPHRAYFGQKDAQQVLVIKKMVEDLNIPVEIVTVPTAREADGLAMSSRNVYLTPEQRAAAPILNKSLREAAGAVSKGERDVKKLVAMVSSGINGVEGASIDYVEVRSLPDLEEMEILEVPALMALAVRFGNTRLIDNIILGE
ncbi:MAG: pantoate--beta-alanine ligase [Firmicutes bacterium]|nr:pantoate--beta-alanine ligase [Bacillota bacterium]MCL5058405.1 pantoate--beta-alanine ligase [Actinomycetota bacterium]